MVDDRFADIIDKINKDTGKFYEFMESHNPRLPVDYWFQQPPEGFTLFLVLYTRTCRWAQCLGCNLPSMVSQYEVPFFNIMKQVDYIFDFMLSQEQKNNLKKIILSNNGSVLDESTFSTTALLYFVAKMNMNCSNIKVLTLETRPEYVDIEELEVMHRALQEGPTPTDLEIAIGFEAFNDNIRNDVFNKGLTLEMFEAMVRKISKYDFRLKTYFMLKPVPNMSEEEAIADILKGIDYLHSISIKYNIKINMHLNPTYVACGTALETAFKEGNYNPPQLESVEKTVKAAQGKSISIYVGLNDEGLAVPGGSFIRKEDEPIRQRLLNFNHTGDFSYLL